MVKMGCGINSVIEGINGKGFVMVIGVLNKVKMDGIIWF